MNINALALLIAAEMQHPSLRKFHQLPALGEGGSKLKPPTGAPAQNPPPASADLRLVTEKKRTFTGLR